MGRVRTKITPDRLKHEGNLFFAYLRHPARNNKTVCINLGDRTEYLDNLDDLNRILLDPASWFDPPRNKVSESIYRQWLGPEAIVKLRGSTVTKGSKLQKSDAKANARLLAENAALKQKVEELLTKLEAAGKEIEHWRGKKITKGPRPTLGEAADAWFKKWSARRDDEYAKAIRWDLDKFVKHFVADTKIDDLEGCEGEIDTWLQNLKVPVEKDKDGKVTKWRPISASRLHQVRVYILKMLTESGVHINRKLIGRAKQTRGTINWLTRADAESVLNKLPSPFAEAFQIQVAIGLRPDELLTLRAENFKRDYRILELQPLDNLTLKTGSRIIPIPETLQPMLKLRARISPVLFADPDTKKPWSNPKMFTRRYKKALVKAAAEAGVKATMDSRIGRRTCASLLMQDNVSAEKVAKLLGNSPAMILSHYGDPDIEKLDLSKTAIIQTEGDKQHAAVS